MEPVRRRLAQVGLAAAGRYGFALAGGYGIQAHGILERPREDVDLFTAWDRRIEFPAGSKAVAAAYRELGLLVEVVIEFEIFARLKVVDPAGGHPPESVDLSAHLRSREPVMMDIGPVLHADDLAADKMDALYKRHAPLDFLDIDAFVAVGRYDGEQLCELARRVTRGFDRTVLAGVLDLLDQHPDEDFRGFGVGPDHIAAMRGRVRAWRATLPGGT
jgi:hypothetical protein